MKLFTQITPSLTRSASDVSLSAGKSDPYMEAVTSGDMETAQKMVDEKANANGYTIGPVYHGTDAEFYIFDKSSDLGYHFGSEQQAMYKRGRRVISAYLSMTDPLRLDDHVWDNPRTLAVGLSQFDSGKELENAAARWEALKHDETELDQDLPWNEFKKKHRELLDLIRSARLEAMRIGKNLLQNAKNDGVIYKNEVEGGGDSYIAFKSNQIKSADPVTYDKDKKPIPLNKRFDSSNPDIRY